MGNDLNREKRIFNPDSYVILIALIVLVCILTWVLPAGQYDTIEGSKAVDPESFHLVEPNPATLWDFLNSFVKGMSSVATTIWAYLFIGGAFNGVLTATGAIEAVTTVVIRKTGGNYKLIIPAFMTVMAILGCLGIGNNVTIAFAPLLISLAGKLGLDGCVVAAMIFVGSNVGFATSFMNPFTVIIAQDIAGVAPLSGAIVRFCWFVFCSVVAVIYVLRYCDKITKDPSKSVVGIMPHMGDSEEAAGTLTGKHLLNIIIMFGIFAVYAWGGITRSWGVAQLATCMIGMTLICGLVNKMPPSELAKHFRTGLKSVVGAAMVVGLAGAISVIMSDANIIHSIVYYCTLPLDELPKSLASVGMLLINFLINFPINSGSAQAYAVMPIMAPAADVLGISRQIAISAYQFGDGMCNMVTPTNALMLGTIAACGVSYGDWLKFIWKFVVLIVALCAAFLVGVTLAGWC